jgi:hypothetical protein
MCRPPLWPSGQSSWLQIRRPEFDSRHYQKKLVGLELGALSLVSTTEELLDRKVAAPVQEIENTAVGIRHADHVVPSIRKSWQSLHRQAAVARSVLFARGLRPWSLFCLVCVLRITGLLKKGSMQYLTWTKPFAIVSDRVFINSYAISKIISSICK